MAKGWRNESRRHSLAAKGVKTVVDNKPLDRVSQYKQGKVLPLSEQRANYETYILDSIDNSGYDNAKPLITPKEKLQFLQNTLKSEYGHEIERKGTQTARADWLSGLPSSIDLPFQNNEILTFAEKMGSLRNNPTEKEEERILEGYWNYMSNQIGRLNTKYGVK